MWNSKRSNIYAFEDLLEFFKGYFAIFYRQSHLSPPIDRKIFKFTNFLNKNILLFSLIYFICFAWTLHFCYCHSKTVNIQLSTHIFLVLNTFATSISMISLLFHYKNVRKLWFELKCLDRLIFKRLNHPINYLKFKRSFLFGPVLVPSLILGFSMYATIRNSQSIALKSIVVCRIAQFYIQLHAIFIISLFQYVYKMFDKSIYSASYFRRLNSTVENINRVDAMIRHYTEIYYKFWLVSREVNRIFGTSVVVFSLETFIDSTRFLCFLFYQWENIFTNDSNINLTS